MEKLENSSRSKSNKYSDDEIKGMLKIFTFSLIGIVVFFIPIKINNQFETIIYHISYYLENKVSPLIEIYLICFVVLFAIKDILKSEKNIFLKIKIGIRFISILILISFIFKKEDIFISDDSSIFILRDTITSIAVLLPVCAIFLPLLLDFGLIELIEACTHKVMKKLFKVSGKVFLNILVYLFVDNICGLFVTYKLYRDGKLRQKEACITILNFSILSFTLTSDLCNKINIKMYKFIILEMIVLTICNIIICRIYPLNTKKQSYFIKSGYKDVNCKKNKLKVAIKKYRSNNTKNKNIMQLSVSYLNEVIYIFADVVPNIIFIFFLGSIIFNIPIISENINNIFNMVIDIFRVSNSMEIAQITSLSLFHNILGIKNISETTYYCTNIIISLIITLQCINIAILIPFIKKSIIPLSLREVLIVYIERIIIILTLSTIAYYIYINYLI